MNHTIQNAFLKVSVAELGAELQSIQNAEGKEFLWQGTALIGSKKLSIFFLMWAG